jgi:hypothetical protein
MLPILVGLFMGLFGMADAGAGGQQWRAGSVWYTTGCSKILPKAG